MSTKLELFELIVGNWSDEDCHIFIKSKLRDICIDLLDNDFSECDSVAKVMYEMNPKYLAAPSKYSSGGNK